MDKVLYIMYMFCLFPGSRTVIHTKAKIIAEGGPIVIGENNLIEEQAQIFHRSDI